jgi:hypothetical protein
MSLLSFQLALADLAASVDLCRRVADDPAGALAGYDLTPVEHRRLVAAARQQGMRVNVALYRYNRIVALTSVVPATVQLLGADARAVVDEFWAGSGPDRNMRREAERFADFLRRGVASGRLASPFLLEVLEFEMARYEASVAPRTPLLEQVAADAGRWPDGPLALHPLVRLARFGHEPWAMLGHLARREPPPWDDVPEGEFYLFLDYRGGGLDQHPFDAAWAAIVRDAVGGRPAPPDAVARLLEMGILVRTPPSADQPAPGEPGPAAERRIPEEAEASAAAA